LEEVEETFANLMSIYSEQSDGKKIKDKVQKLRGSAKEMRQKFKTMDSI
jgi:hypothetical protein